MSKYKFCSQNGARASFENMLARDIKLQLNTTQIGQPSEKQLLTEVVNFEEEEK